MRRFATTSVCYVKSAKIPLLGTLGTLTVRSNGVVQPIVRAYAGSTAMAASRRHLVSVAARVKRSGKLDSFQGFFAHNHGLYVNEPLNTSCVLGLWRVQVLPRTIAQGCFVASNVNVVLDANARSVKWLRFVRVEVATRGHDDPSR